MVRQTKKKQRGRGQGMSATLAAPRISLIDIIRSEAEDEEKMVLIDNAIQGGADINERDADGITPLIALITNTNSAGDFIKDLVGRDINYIDNNIGSALHYAIVNLQDEYMLELLENGANINLRNASGQTPLFLASLYAIDDYVHTLLDRRADYIIPDNEGRLPIEVVALEYNGINRINNKYNIIGQFCDRGANNPELCQERVEWVREAAERAAQLRLLLNHELRDNNVPILVIPEVSQVSKIVPADKITNAISFEDIKDGEDIIVITEKGGAEFFYKVDTITRWFAEKDAQRHPKTNPGTGLTIKDQNQLSR